MARFTVHVEGRIYRQETAASPQPLCGPFGVFGAGVVGDHAGAAPATLRHNLMRGRAGPRHAPRHADPPGMPAVAGPQAGGPGRGLDAARDRGHRQAEDRVRAGGGILRPARIEVRHRNRRQIDRARAGIGFRAPHRETAGDVVPARDVIPDQRGGFRAPQAGRPTAPSRAQYRPAPGAARSPRPRERRRGRRGADRRSHKWRPALPP